MGNIVSPRFGRALYWASIVAAFAVGMALVLAADPFLPQPPSLPTLTVQSTTSQIPQKFEPQIPQKFEVVDGDTVDFQSARYRLVGFNTPKSGTNAQCAAERAMAAKAVQRLHQLLASGEPYLQRVPCACAPGTEGTERCNYGRLCGVLTIGGKDVGPILIAEGLAEQYICGGTRCPQRRNWCRR
jgi:endonuclease YncB( thermonuclease family)